MPIFRFPLAPTLLLAIGLGSPILPVEAQEPVPEAVLTEPGQAVVFRGGWLFDGTGEERVRNPGILVRGGKFLAVGPDAEGAAPSGARIVELADDETVLPGMFNLHAHHRMSFGGEAGADEDLWLPLLHLASGVTSVFTAGESTPHALLAASERIDSGEQIGTRIFNSGPYFGNARNVCPHVRTYRGACLHWPADITEEEIRDRIDYWADRGVRSLKAKQASPEELAVIIDHAHRRGLTVTGHLHNYEGRGMDVSYRQAILMGIDRIEHSFVDQPVILEGGAAPGTPEFEEWIRLYLDHEVYFNGTNWLYGRAVIEADSDVVPADIRIPDDDRFLTSYALELRERYQAERGPDRRTPQEREWDRINGRPGYTPVFRNTAAGLVRLHELGGGHLITTGTDYWSGFHIHNEIFALTFAGLPNDVALRAATSNGASALGVGERLGTVEVGKVADLYVVEGNPLEEISTTRNGRLVMKAGQLFDVQTLIRAAEGKIGPTAPEDADS